MKNSKTRKKIMLPFLNKKKFNKINTDINKILKNELNEDKIELNNKGTTSQIIVSNRNSTV